MHVLSEDEIKSVAGSGMAYDSGHAAGEWVANELQKAEWELEEHAVSGHW